MRRGGRRGGETGLWCKWAYLLWAMALDHSMCHNRCFLAWTSLWGFQKDIFYGSHPVIQSSLQVHAEFPSVVWGTLTLHTTPHVSQSALRLSNQSQPLQSVLGFLTFGNAFESVHYEKHNVLIPHNAQCTPLKGRSHGQFRQHPSASPAVTVGKIGGSSSIS